MKPYFLRPRAPAHAGQQFGPPPVLLRTSFDYQAAWRHAHQRDDMEGEREASEDPNDLRSEPADDIDEDDLPDFDPPQSPFATPPASPLLDATTDTQLDEDLSDLEDDDTVEPDVQSLFAGRILLPTSFSGSQFNHVTLPSPNTSPPSSVPPDSRSRLQDEGSSIPSKRARSPSARAANRARKDKKKREDIAERRREGGLPIHGEAFIGRHAESHFVSGDFSVMDFGAVSGGDTGKIGGSAKKGKGCSKNKVKADVSVTLASAAKKRYSYFAFDGITTTQILDSSKKIAIVCGGKPVDPANQDPSKTWDAGHKRLAEFLEDIRQRYGSTFSSKEKENRRGPYYSKSIGITRGSGAKTPLTLSHKSSQMPMVDELLSNHDIHRIVAFQNELLAAHYPLIYHELKTNMDAICKNQPELKMNFPGRSVYPACGLNLGPSTVTKFHTDPGNCPRVPCEITSAGNFDPDKGGHLVLEDLKLVIRFPPGSTIVLSSASIRHCNIPIREGESRYSITQFCPGGLYRWVRHGFVPACTLSEDQRRELDGDAELRWKEGWDLLSTPETLLDDRRWLVEQEQAQVAELVKDSV